MASVAELDIKEVKRTYKKRVPARVAGMAVPAPAERKVTQERKERKYSREEEYSIPKKLNTPNSQNCKHGNTCKIYDCRRLHPLSRLPLCRAGVKCNNKEKHHLDTYIHPPSVIQCINETCGGTCIDKNCKYYHQHKNDNIPGHNIRLSASTTIALPPGVISVTLSPNANGTMIVSMNTEESKD